MTTKTLLAISPDDLVPDPMQPRKHFSEESLVGLGKTLATTQLQPIVAYRHNNKFIIIDGERRWRAAKLSGVAKVDVLVVETPPEACNRLRQQLIANIQRENLTPIEKARAMDLLMKSTKRTASEVSLDLGISPASISKLLALLVLPEEIQKKVDNGEIAASTAYEIVKVRDGGTRTRLAEETVAGSLTRKNVSERIKSCNRESAVVKPRRAGVKRSRIVVPVVNGLSIAITNRDFTLALLIGHVESILSKFREFESQGVEFTTAIQKLTQEKH